MIDYHKNIVTALSSIGIPVHYEMVLHSGLEVPCISYMELTNYVTVQTDITDISIIQYQIKVWANRVSDLQEYALKIDEVMRDIDFKRTSSAELYDNNSTMMQKVLTYEALASETIVEEPTQNN